MSLLPRSRARSKRSHVFGPLTSSAALVRLRRFSFPAKLQYPSNVPVAAGVGQELARWTTGGMLRPALREIIEKESLCPPICLWFAAGPLLRSPG